MGDPVSELAGEKYISLTTYKQDGGAVDVPVWVVADGGQLLFTTPAGSYKVKRLARNPAVVVRPCDMRGRVESGAPEYTGTGTVITDVEGVAAAHRAVRSKYGIQHALARGAEKFRQRVRRDGAGDAAIHLQLEAD